MPLLHLIIVPGEVGHQKDDVNQDFITPHLRDWYEKYPTLVSMLVEEAPVIHDIQDFSYSPPPAACLPVHPSATFVKMWKTG